MKRFLPVLLIGIIIAGVVFAQAGGRTMYVSAKTAELKASTGAFSDKIADLALGDRVTLIRESGKWAEVRTDDAKTGWILLASITSRRVTGSGYSATAGEIALAGKGFSPETELEYKKNGLNYSAVDQMERFSISSSDLRKFITDGRLAEGE